MDKKCNKYEGYFTFANEADFNSHLKDCADCQKEHSEQQKVSNLLKEAAPAYRKRDKSRLTKKMTACLAALMLIVGSLVPYSIESYKISQMNYMYNESSYETNFIYDEYGLVQM